MEAKKRLKLSKETLAVLTDEQTHIVAGGIQTAANCSAVPCGSDACNSVSCKNCGAGGITGALCLTGAGGGLTGSACGNVTLQCQVTDACAVTDECG
jgi:hypothetical protein